MPALILAFDGVLADTLPLRTHALADACAAEFHPRTREQVGAIIAGRTMLEASLALFPAEAARDPTLPELIALRAQRAYRHLVQHGVPLRADVVRDMQDAIVHGTRIVVRADSERRDVEPLLAMASLDHQVNLLRCSDDAPGAPGASLGRSWQAIDGRLTAMQQPAAERIAWETGESTAAAAQPFVSAVHTRPPDRSH
jgi:beta-phosphoglucomutase-like phosphatase (HAD superfamily)